MRRARSGVPGARAVRDGLQAQEVEARLIVLVLRGNRHRTRIEGVDLRLVLRSADGLRALGPTSAAERDDFMSEQTDCL
jgi:hypothetical protein